MTRSAHRYPEQLHLDSPRGHATRSPIRTPSGRSTRHFANITPRMIAYPIRICCLDHWLKCTSLATSFRQPATAHVPPPSDGVSGHLLQGRLNQNSIWVESVRPLGSYVDHWDVRHQHKGERATWHFLGRIPHSLHSRFACGKGLQSFGSSCFWAFHCFAMDSKELSSISDCFGDQKAIKTPKLNTIWLELIARVLNMLIRLKGGNYYSKVFKRVNYKLWNNTFWVVITPPNQHIASPLAMKERKIKIKSIIIYNIMLIKKTIFKWHDDLTLTWNIKEI